MDHIYRFSKVSASSMSVAYRRLRHARDWVAKPILEGLSNLYWTRGDKRILILRHRLSYPRMYREYLSWLADKLPEVRRRVELRSLPIRIRDWSRYGVVVPWIFDPMLQPPRWEHQHMQELERACAGHGIPVINPLAGVLQTSKSEGARRIAEAGFRTPRTHVISDVQQFKKTLGGLSLPLLIREDRAHAGHLPIFRIESRDQLDDVPFEQFEHPVAMEFIDVRDSDGYCRRYRYFVIGSSGISCSVHVSKGWEVRGKNKVHSEAAKAEDTAYSLSPNPHYEQFHRAARILQLDFVAFDYSYDHNKQPVVWEANTLPGAYSAYRDQSSSFAFEADVISSALTTLYLTRMQVVPPTCVQQWLQHTSLPIRTAEAA